MTKFDILTMPAYQDSRPGEEMAQEIIKKVFNVSIVENDKTPGRDNYREYDFKTSNGIKYEVKEDKRSLETGNFFIETAQNYGTGKKAACIKVTKSNYYMILSGNKFYTIPTFILTCMIEDLEQQDLNEPDIKKKKEKRHYDPIRVHTRYGYIIPIKDLKEYAKIIEF